MFSWFKKILGKVEETSNKEKWISGFIASAYVFFLGGHAGKAISANMDFYNNLILPAGTPPSWVFSVVWTVLFALIGLSGYYAWNFYQNDGHREIFMGLYFVNGGLIFFWPYVFFGLQQMVESIYVLIGMIVVIELMILTGFKTNKRAAYLLIPYLVWVLIATYWTTSIIALNQ